MDDRTRDVIMSASAVIAIQAVGAVVAIANRWPAQLGGARDPDGIIADFFYFGTPFSAPFFLLAIYSIAVAGSMRPGRPGRMSTWIVTGVTAVFMIGFAGEALWPHTGQVPAAALWTGAIVGVTVCAVALRMCLRRLRQT